MDENNVDFDEAENGARESLEKSIGTSAAAADISLRRGGAADNLMPSEAYENTGQFEDSDPLFSGTAKSQFDDADEAMDETNAVPQQLAAALPKSTNNLNDARRPMAKNLHIPTFPKISASAAAAMAAEKAAEFRFRKAQIKAAETDMKIKKMALGGRKQPEPSALYASKPAAKEYVPAVPSPSLPEPTLKQFQISFKEITPHDVLCGQDVGSYPNAG